TMAELVAEGKVRWAGVSNFDVALLERCEAIHHVDSLQPPLSLLSRHARAELVPWCREHGTGVIVYSPMASGLLTGSFNREGLDRTGSRRDGSRDRRAAAAAAGTGCGLGTAGPSSPSARRRRRDSRP